MARKKIIQIKGYAWGLANHCPASYVSVKAPSSSQAVQRGVAV